MGDEANVDFAEAGPGLGRCRPAASWRAVPRRDDRARADFRRVVALDPGNNPAHLRLAPPCRRAGDRDGARAQDWS